MTRKSERTHRIKFYFKPLGTVFFLLLDKGCFELCSHRATRRHALFFFLYRSELLGKCQLVACGTLLWLARWSYLSPEKQTPKYRETHLRVEIGLVSESETPSVVGPKLIVHLSLFVTQLNGFFFLYLFLGKEDLNNLRWIPASCHGSLD